jgi:hypothetical protein
VEKPLSVKKYRLRYGPVAADLFADRSWDSFIRPLVVSFPGLPDFAGPTALTNAFVRQGAAVLQPHLAGTYDSDGEFSPEGCRQTLSETWRAISSGGLTPASGASPLQVEPSRITLHGHSFGGITVLRNFTEFDSLNAIVFTSAALRYGGPETDYGLREDGRDGYEGVRSSHPYTYRLADVERWDAILRGADPIPAEPLGAVDHVRIIYGENDKYFDIDAVRKNTLGLVRSYVETPNLQLDILAGAGHYLPEIVAVRPVESLMPEVFG